jgi:hypothetical protein
MGLWAQDGGGERRLEQKLVFLGILINSIDAAVIRAWLWWQASQGLLLTCGSRQAGTGMMGRAEDRWQTNETSQVLVEEALHMGSPLLRLSRPGPECTWAVWYSYLRLLAG